LYEIAILRINYAIFKFEFVIFKAASTLCCHCNAAYFVSDDDFCGVVYSDCQKSWSEYRYLGALAASMGTVMAGGLSGSAADSAFGAQVGWHDLP
jgi:hypothetical protein